MKVKIISNKKQVEPKPFPKLMIDVNDNQIILFTSPTSGTTIQPGINGESEVGEWSDCWDDLFSLFIDFEGKIELSND